MFRANLTFLIRAGGGVLLPLPPRPHPPWLRDWSRENVIDVKCLHYKKTKRDTTALDRFLN